MTIDIYLRLMAVDIRRFPDGTAGGGDSYLETGDNDGDHSGRKCDAGNLGG
jgi:hypothetical protein